MRPGFWARLLLLALTVPSVIFVSSNVLKYELGVGFLHDALRPVVAPRSEPANALLALAVMGLPLLAVALTFWRTARIRFRRKESLLETNVTLRVGWLEGITLVAGLGALTIIFLHFVAEGGP